MEGKSKSCEGPLKTNGQSAVLGYLEAFHFKGWHDENTGSHISFGLGADAWRGAADEQRM
jgi:hypothetical protein